MIKLKIYVYWIICFHELFCQVRSAFASFCFLFSSCSTVFTFFCLSFQLFCFSLFHGFLFLKFEKQQFKTKNEKLLTMAAILSLKLLYRSLLAIIKSSSIFSPVLADVSNEKSMFFSRLNYSIFSMDTSR